MPNEHRISQKAVSGTPQAWSAEGSSYASESEREGDEAMEENKAEGHTEAEFWKRLTDIGKCECLNHHSWRDIISVYLAIWNWPANSQGKVWKLSKCFWMPGVGRHHKDIMRSGMSVHYWKVIWFPHISTLVRSPLWYSFWDQKTFSLWDDITTLRCQKMISV